MPAEEAEIDPLGQGHGALKGSDRPRNVRRLSMRVHNTCAAHARQDDAVHG